MATSRGVHLFARGLASVVTLGAMAAVGAIAASCAGATTPAPGTGEPSAAEAGTPPPTIRIAHNDWLSATLNDEVARILLVEQMGIPVELVPAGTSDQFDSIRAG